MVDSRALSSNAKFSKIVLFALLLLSSSYKRHVSQSELDDVKMQLWLSSLWVVNSSYTWSDAVAFINEDPSAVKEWASDSTPMAFCTLIYKAPWGRIWSLSYFYSLNSIFVRDVVVPAFEENDYVLIPFWGKINEEGELNKALIRNAKFPQNYYFLGNSDQCTRLLRNEGLQAYTVSHNAFIDRDHFCPIDVQRLYDVVYLGSCRPQKRLDLASSVLSELLVVTDSDEVVRKVVSQAKKIVFNPVISSIPQYVGQARCGLILSAVEGGCYASTEYLYCGIPVVSTNSVGGRDAYYDDVTAIIVDDTPEAVRKGVEIMCMRRSDPWEIRRRALAVSDKMLDTLANEILLPIFASHRDAHAADPRGFVNIKMKESNRLGSKGRTVFQPEIPTHDRIEKIKKEQKN